MLEEKGVGSVIGFLSLQVIGFQNRICTSPLTQFLTNVNTWQILFSKMHWSQKFSWVFKIQKHLAWHYNTSDQIRSTDVQIYAQQYIHGYICTIMLSVFATKQDEACQDVPSKSLIIQCQLFNQILIIIILLIVIICYFL